MKDLLLITALLLFKAEARHVSESDQKHPDTSQVLDHQEETFADGSIESRFLTPAAYEGLGRLFALHSELASCHSCSPSYPNQATECCFKGYTACCTVDTVSHISDSNPIIVPNYNQWNKEGQCPLVSADAYLFRQCFKQCRDDYDCPLETKCCPYNSCSTTCTKPIRRSTFISFNSNLDADDCSSYSGYTYSTYPQVYVLNPPCLSKRRQVLRADTSLVN